MSELTETAAQAEQLSEEQRLLGQLAQSGDADAYCDAWLALQCRLLGPVHDAVLLLGQADSGPFSPVSQWPAEQAIDAGLQAWSEQSLAARQPTLHSSSDGTWLSSPIQLDGQFHGLVALRAAPVEEPAARRMLESLQLGTHAIGAMLRSRFAEQEQSTRERLIATLDLAACALVEETFLASVNALATHLAVKLDCDRVSIGYVKRGSAHVVAMSHSAELGARMNLVRAIGMAMDEALDQKCIVCLPGPDSEVLVTRDHEVLLKQHGTGHVLTVPFSAGTGVSGAFTFERPDDLPFEQETIELCQAVTAICSRIVETKRLNDRGWLRRVGDAAHAELSRLIGPRHFGRKLAAVVLLFGAVFFSFATGDYRVGANATLEGTVRRVLVAPFDGYVASAAHRAGDVVKAGTVLATLDDRDLRLEYYKWSSQRSQFTKQYQDFVAQHDRAQASIVLAQVQQATAQMNLLAEQLGRTQIQAPFDGLVVSGDLNQSLGSSLKRGQVLFEVAPLSGYRVILEVEEGEITAIQPGQKGNLMLTALPGEVFPVSISYVTPIALSREGKSHFRVEALLAQTSERFRPGMEGVAKVEIGERKLFWIATHRLVDWLRLSFWTWL